MERRQFSIYEKCVVVEFALENSALSAANNYNVHLNNVYRWIRDYRNGLFDDIAKRKKKKLYRHKGARRKQSIPPDIAEQLLTFSMKCVDLCSH